MTSFSLYAGDVPKYRRAVYGFCIGTDERVFIEDGRSHLFVHG